MEGQKVFSRADDTRSNEELVEGCLTTEDEDARWDLVWTIRRRGGETEFRLAEDLCRSTDPKRRELGADILGQLGGENLTFQDESVTILLELLNDPDETVQYSAIMALGGHRNDPRSVPPVCALAAHPDSDIRYAVAVTLGGVEDADATAVLIQLSDDPNDEVRNWATFGLGSLSEADSPEIREALFARTEEKNGEIRGEALIGLARRKDERALGLVLRELDGPFEGSWVLEAAELLADASLVAPLSSLREVLQAADLKRFGDELDDAIAACTPKAPFVV